MVSYSSLHNFDESMLFHKEPLGHYQSLMTCWLFLGKARYFTTVDLRSGYLQIPLRDEDNGKTTFGFHIGLHEYNVFPFGLMNGPSTFQQTMSVVHEFGDIAMAYLNTSPYLVHL